MELETARISFIPGDKLENLKDGECISYSSNTNGDIHIDLAIQFLNDYKLNKFATTTSIESICKFLASVGVVSFVNLGLIDGKRGAIIYLPSELTHKQIEFLEDNKNLFKTIFYDNDSLFKTFVYPDCEIGYKTTSGLRDLKLENLIYNKNMNGQEELFEEIENKKSNIKNK